MLHSCRTYDGGHDSPQRILTTTTTASIGVYCQLHDDQQKAFSNISQFQNAFIIHDISLQHAMHKKQFTSCGKSTQSTNVISVKLNQLLKIRQCRELNQPTLHIFQGLQSSQQIMFIILCASVSFYSTTAMKQLMVNLNSHISESIF